MKFKIYSKDDYDRSLDKSRKFNSLDSAWCYNCETDDFWKDLDDLFKEAAAKAFDDYGREDRWDENSPEFVAVDENKKVFKTTIVIEYDPVFYCGRTVAYE